MNAFTYGQPVTVTTVAGRARHFMRRMSHGTRWVRLTDWDNPDALAKTFVAVESISVTLYHHQRAHSSLYAPNEGEVALWAQRTLAAPDVRPVAGETHVHVVSVPVVDLTPVWQRDRPETLRGIVIGQTHRQAGVVFPIGWDDGNGWRTTGSTPVITVAAETDGVARIYDVPPDGLHVR